MPRIPYPDPATLPDAVRRVVIQYPSNVTRMLAAASESVFKGFAALSMEIGRASCRERVCYAV